jgi:hypothetical protein
MNSEKTDLTLLGVPIVEKDVRFYNSRVVRADGCWKWSGSKLPKGYGLLMSHSTRRKVFSAHRFSWTIHRGVIPNGKHVLHRCDNPECSNPDHLFLGTPKENMRDAINKGRRNTGVRPSGEKHWKAKLTASQVLQIREDHKRNVSQADLARQYGVGQTAINKIVSRQLWRTLE